MKNTDFTEKHDFKCYNIFNLSKNQQSTADTAGIHTVMNMRMKTEAQETVKGGL